MIGPREVDRPLVLYGYGRLGHLAEEMFLELGIFNYRVIDKFSEDDIPDKDGYLVAVCIASEPYTPIAESLKAQGFSDVVPAWDILEFYADRTGIHNGWFAPKLSGQELDDLQSKTEFVYRRLSGTSSIAYHNFIGWRYGHTEYELRDDPLPSLPSTLADIRARQKVRTDFKWLTWPRDLVSIHAEGCELKTLELNMDLFRMYRPKISCACYHSRDGLWAIEKFCMDNLPDYQWTFRLHAYQGQAAYLYGVPKERA